MKSMICRTPVVTVAVHWLTTLLLLAGAVAMAWFIFVAPEKGPSGHGALFAGAAVVSVGITGLFWLSIAVNRTFGRLVLEESGLTFASLFSRLTVPWEDVMAVSYHCVTTRLGRSATVSTILSEKGIVSFLSMGSQGDTMDRELDRGALYMVTLSAKDRERVMAVIGEQTGLEAESEQEW